MPAKALTFKRAKRLRREMTLPEVILWEHLRKGKLGALRFRRQHPMATYILDFYCPSARLAIEIDGAGHGHPDQEAHDRARDRWIEEEDLTVIRFAAASVLDEEALAGVLQEIEAVALAPPPPPLRGPPPP